MVSSLTTVHLTQQSTAIALSFRPHSIVDLGLVALFRENNKDDLEICEFDLRVTLLTKVKPVIKVGGSCHSLPNAL